MVIVGKYVHRYLDSFIVEVLYALYPSVGDQGVVRWLAVDLPASISDTRPTCSAPFNSPFVDCVQYFTPEKSTFAGQLISQQ